MSGARGLTVMQAIVWTACYVICAEAQRFVPKAGADQLKGQGVTPFHRDSLWQNVNSCDLPGSPPHMGVFYDRGTLWHVENITSSGYAVYHMDTLGTVLSIFSAADVSYAVDLHRLADTIFVATYYPEPEHVRAYDTLGNMIRTFSLSNGGRCRGLDYDPNTGMFWVWGSPQSGQVDIYICDRVGTVRKTIPIVGGDWTFSGCIDWRYYPTRVWFGGRPGYSFFYSQIDTATATGTILATFPSPASSGPTGIAYCEQAGAGFVWVTGTYAPRAYKMKVHETGLKEEAMSHEQRAMSLRICPNPCRSRVTITLNSADQAISRSAGGTSGHQQPDLRIYDVSGRVVKSLSITNNQSPITIHWNAGGPQGTALPAGVYFVRLEAGGSVVAKKVVVLE